MTGRPPRVLASPRVQAWALYDFANSPFTTLVVTFIYGTYFTQAVAGNEIQGTVLWSRAVTVTALGVALLSPPLGAMADRAGLRRPFLTLFTWLCVAATAALYLPRPGDVMAALALFVAANLFYELAGVFYNARLPDVAPPARLGTVSGYGWGLGYAGGLLALVVALAGFVQPEVPWFGLTRDAGQNIRATNLLSAAWLAVFSLPLLLLPGRPAAAGVPRQPESRRRRRPLRLLLDSHRELMATLSQVRRYRQTFRFLLARLVYNDGLVTIFAFGGIYAAGTFGFTFTEILVFGIVINVSAGAGAWIMGWMDDRLGGRTTIMVSLVGLLVATGLAALTPTRSGLWVAGLIIGFAAGPNQSASRSLMARFTPAGRENEFFGFFAFSGKATAFAGPLLLGQLTVWTGSQRAGVAVVAVLFAAGLVLLARVDEAGGRAAARAPGA